MFNDNVYCILNIVLVFGDTSVNKTDKTLTFIELTFYEGRQMVNNTKIHK